LIALIFFLHEHQQQLHKYVFFPPIDKRNFVMRKWLERERQLTLNLLTITIVAPPSNASKWQMGFNSAFKGLMKYVLFLLTVQVHQ